MVVLDVGNPFFTDIARAAEQRAADHDLTVLLGTSDDDESREQAYLDTFDEQRVFGLLVSPIGDDLRRFDSLRRRGTPVILVDRDAGGSPFDSVAVDGAVLEVVNTTNLSVLAGREAGTALLAREPHERPDAVFCANDLLAIGVLQAFTMLGGDVRVPDDIALIGYDDIDFARSAVVPLSSIRQPTSRIGVTAVDLLISAANNPAERHVPSNLVFQPELVVRASTLG